MILAKFQNTKINTEKSFVFLYTKNDQSKKEIKKIASFTVA